MRKVVWQSGYIYHRAIGREDYIKRVVRDTFAMALHELLKDGIIFPLRLGCLCEEIRELTDVKFKITLEISE